MPAQGCDRTSGATLGLTFRVGKEDLPTQGSVVEAVVTLGWHTQPRWGFRAPLLLGAVRG